MLSVSGFLQSCLVLFDKTCVCRYEDFAVGGRDHPLQNTKRTSLFKKIVKGTKLGFINILGEKMSKVITENRTFEELLKIMVGIRQKGGSSVIKRENFSDFADINENIEFEKEHYLQFASFGYIERLIRKLAAEYSLNRYSLLKILSYQEACGFFSGELALYLDAVDKKSFETIRFTWEGKGEIEETWNNFTLWQKMKK